MSLLPRLLLIVSPVVVMAILVASFLHAPTTVLVVADTDALIFVPNSIVAFAIEGTVSTGCASGAPLQPPPQDFKGRVEARAANVSIARLAAHTLNVVLVPKSGSSIDLVGDGATYDLPCAVSLLVPADFFTKGDALFSLAASVSSLTIGGTGLTSSDTRGVTLVSATAQTLTKTLFGDGVIRGSPVPLTLGDVVHFAIGVNGSTAPAVVFARVQSDGDIAVTAHLPIETLQTGSIGSSGTSVWVSWWDRVAAEPTLLLISTLFGVLIALPGTWKGILAVASMGKMKGARRANRGAASKGVGA